MLKIAQRLQVKQTSDIHPIVYKFKHANIEPMIKLWKVNLSFACSDSVIQESLNKYDPTDAA